MIIDEGKRRGGKKKKREGKERDRWTLRVMTHFLKLIFIGELHYIVFLLYSKENQICVCVCVFVYIYISLYTYMYLLPF